MQIFGISIVELATIVALTICTVAFILTMRRISRQPQQKQEPTEKPKEESKEKQKLLDALEKLKT